MVMATPINYLPSPLFDAERPRKIRSRGCLSNKTSLAMIFKLDRPPQKIGIVSAVTTSCRKFILGIKFNDRMGSSERKLKPLPPALTRH